MTIKSGKQPFSGSGFLGQGCLIYHIMSLFKKNPQFKKMYTNILYLMKIIQSKRILLGTKWIFS